MCFRPMLLGRFLFASTQIGWLSDGGMAPPHCAFLHNRMPVAEFSYVMHLRDTLGRGHNVASACCVCGLPDHIKHSPAQFTHSHPPARIHSHTVSLSLHLTCIHSLHIPCSAMLCHATLSHLIPSYPSLTGSLFLPPLRKFACARNAYDYLQLFVIPFCPPSVCGLLLTGRFFSFLFPGLRGPPVVCRTTLRPLPSHVIRRLRHPSHSRRSFQYVQTRI